MELRNQLLHGDCLEVLKKIPDETFDSCVSDVPYGLGKREPTPEEILQYLSGSSLKLGDFMDKDWEIPSLLVWKEIYRVLKPGAYVLCFGGTRTFDLISLGIRMAGFECRDCIADFSVELPVLQWTYGSGMPKSHNVGKALDKKKGAVRENDFKSTTVRQTPNSNSHRGTHVCNNCGKFYGSAAANCKCPKSKPVTEEAITWEGYGTGLKPAWEPILLFRKPFKGSVADNVLRYGTGALNIDATRVKHASKEDFEEHQKQVEAVRKKGGVRGNSWKNASDLSGAEEVKEAGRWPANLVLSHAPECQRSGSKIVRGSNNPGRESQRGIGFNVGSHKAGSIPSYTDPNNYGMEEVDSWVCTPGCPVAEMDAQSGSRPSTLTGRADPAIAHEHPGTEMKPNSTFLGERQHLSRVYADAGGASRFFTQFDGVPFRYIPKANRMEAGSHEFEVLHPTLKPLALMRWLVRLVTQKGGLVLDPYCGSGSTCHAALIEGCDYLGIERDKDSFEEAQRRLNIVVHEYSLAELAMGGDEV